MDSTEVIHQHCLHARKVGGWFNHPNRGIIEIGGAERIQFLHNILTNDIKSLGPGSGIQACLLTAQAKIIALVNVLCFENHLWLAFDYVLKNQLREAIEKLIIMEQVTVKDLSDELKLFSAHGPKAKELIMSFPHAFSGNLDPRLKHSGMTALSKPLSHISVSMNGIPLTIIKINLVGEEGFGILAPKAETSKLKAAIEQNAAALEIIELEPEAVEIMRIGAAIPKYGVDYDESNIPLECRLDHTISFTKGCFPGQEIIARLDSRGGVSKKLCGLVLKGEIIPKKNDRVLDGTKEVGWVTSAAFVPVLKKTVALGYLQKESWSVGHPLVVDTRTEHIPARVEELPFYSKD